MYGFDEDEKVYLKRKMIPKSRELQVAEVLRGWWWNSPPLEPVYEEKLAVYEVASYYCPTSRDLFLRRVHCIVEKPTVPMLFGGALHETVAKLIILAKRALYVHEIAEAVLAMETLRTPDYSAIDKIQIDLSTDLQDLLRQQIEILWRHQLNAIISQVEAVLAKQPRLSTDSLIALAIPVTVEQNLDGSFLGLSGHLSTDACGLYGTMVMDLKFGEPMDFHKLATAGYALVMESLYEQPVNIGCIVYAHFENDRIFTRNEYHLIDDELRQWFIEARDEKMRMIYEEIDPGLPDECSELCQYMIHCSR